MTNRSFILSLALSLALSGCAGASSPRGARQDGETCLTGPIPQVGRPDADEHYRVLRARWDALPTLHPLAQAALLPTMTAWVPDVSNMIPEPACGPELIDLIERDTFAARPIVLSQTLLSRIRAAGSLRATTDVMPRKADYLLRVSRLRDGELTAYRPTADEPLGHVVTAAGVRALAVYLLGRSNLWSNNDDARSAIKRTLLTSDDAGTLLDLDSDAGSAVRDSPRPLSGALLARERALTAAWLEMPHDPRRFELLLRWVRRLGQGAASVGFRDEVSALLARVVERRGAFPVANGLDGAAHDLWITAVRRVRPRFTSGAMGACRRRDRALPARRGSARERAQDTFHRPSGHASWHLC